MGIFSNWDAVANVWAVGKKCGMLIATHVNHVLCHVTSCLPSPTLFLRHVGRNCNNPTLPRLPTPSPHVFRVVTNHVINLCSLTLI